MKLLIDFFPIVLFFVAFKIKGIFVATVVAIIAGIGQIAYTYFTKKKVEPMMWISLAVIVVFGGATLLLRNEMFIKWKPSVLYWLFGSILLVSQVFFKKNLMASLLGKQLTLPVKTWGRLNASWVGFFYALGGANLIVAYTCSTDTWVNFKLFGIMGLIFAFVIVQSMILSPVAAKMKRDQAGTTTPT